MITSNSRSRERLGFPRTNQICVRSGVALSIVTCPIFFGHLIPQNNIALACGEDLEQSKSKGLRRRYVHKDGRGANP